MPVPLKMVKITAAAVVWLAALTNASVQVLRLMVAPEPDGSFMKLCPMLRSVPSPPLLKLLPIVLFKAETGLEMARVLTRRAVSPPFFLAVEVIGV